MDGRFFDLRGYLLGNLDRDLTVIKMAAKVGLSISHFPTVFKTELGMSPAAFLKEARLEKAKRMIESSYDQIKQIGIQVGMTNDSHFTRDFKIRHGLTPTEYRRQFQEKKQAEYVNGQES